MESPHPSVSPTPPPLRGVRALFSIEPIRLPPDVLRTLPEVRRWIGSPAIAAWGAPYAPTITAAAGLAAGGACLPSSAVPSLRYAVTVDTCAWLTPGEKGESIVTSSCDKNAAVRARSTPPSAEVFDDDLGAPVGVKSMMYVPTTTLDGAAVLGVTMTEEVVACSAGLGRTGSVGTLGRWVLFPHERVLAYAFGTEDGRHVLFGTVQQEQGETASVLSVLQRPTMPGGDPYLVNRLSTLAQRVDGTGGPLQVLADDGISGVPGNDSSASALMAARRFFARTVGTFGEAAVSALSDTALASVAGQAVTACVADAVSSTIARMEMSSSTVVVRLRAAALATAGIHPGGLRLCRPEVSGAVGRIPAGAARLPITRRSRIELATVSDEVTRARIIRNREAARRSNAKRRARTQEARQVAAVAAAAVAAVQEEAGGGGGELPWHNWWQTRQHDG
ncbi:hypothetical protein MMPV_004854 [Pyropia vietnamensis]